MVFGLILIAVGIFLLLQNLGIISADAWDIIWPLIIIAIGLKMILRRKLC